MIKVLLLDDDPLQLGRYERFVRDSLLRVGVEAFIDPFALDMTIPFDKAVASAQAHALKTRPHIILCDNKANNRLESWGQAFLAKMKPQLPETVMCILTRETIKNEQFGLQTPNPDMIIDKGTLGGSDEYREYVGHSLTGLLCRNSGVSIEWHTPFDEIFHSLRDSAGKRATKEIVQSLIEQCLFDGTFENDERSVIVERLPGGRSGSAVMTCRLAGKLAYGVTGVMKISSKFNALQEYKNYNRYVKWVLPYTWKVEVLGTGFTEGLGSICYSFAFDGDGKPQSCTDLLRAADDRVTRLVCESVFNPNNKTWYDQRRIINKDASQYFQQPPYFSRIKQVQEREEKYVEKMQAVFGAHFSSEDTGFKLFNTPATRANRLIFTEDWGNVEECVCHGDLNANNILVNSDRQALAFIDFQNTGYHNIFRDFISFESSVRIDWGAPLEMGNLAALLNQEISLAISNQGPQEGYLKQVMLIRKAAFANFVPEEDEGRPVRYLIAAYIHFSWLATRFTDWTTTAYVRLLLGSYAALVALDRLARR